jgi:Holliday junction resolvase
MHVEKKVQDKIIKAFRAAGFYVIKTKPGPGVPVGMLDVLALKEGCWAVVECKAYPDSPWRPLQEKTFKKFEDWSWARVAHSENVDEVCEAIKALA